MSSPAAEASFPNDPRLTLLGINHHSAPVDVRERLAFRADRLVAAVRELLAADDLQEAVILSTCNRVELYGVGDSPSRVRAALSQFLEEYHGIDLRGFAGRLYHFAGEQAAEQAFRVAASLDSMVIGEAEILGQVKQAFWAAHEAGAIGPTLRALFETSFHVAKAVRRQTRFGRSRVSVASAAVELTGKIFERLTSRRIVVLGTGEAAAGIARSLRAAGGRDVAVTSRTPAHAAAFAKRFGARAFDYADVAAEVARADIVLVGTEATRFLLTRELVAPLLLPRRGRPLLLIDISVPRSVDPRIGDLSDCYLYNIDDLQQIVNTHRTERHDAVAGSEIFLVRGLRRLRARIGGARAAPLVRALREHVERIRADVLAAHEASLRELPPAVRSRLERASSRLLGKVLHPALDSLRQERAQNWAGNGVWPLHQAGEQLLGTAPAGNIPTVDEGVAEAIRRVSARACRAEENWACPFLARADPSFGRLFRTIAEEIVRRIERHIVGQVADDARLAGLVAKMYAVSTNAE